MIAIATTAVVCSVYKAVRIQQGQGQTHSKTIQLAVFNGQTIKP